MKSLEQQVYEIRANKWEGYREWRTLGWMTTENHVHVDFEAWDHRDTSGDPSFIKMLLKIRQTINDNLVVATLSPSGYVRRWAERLIHEQSIEEKGGKV